MSLPETLSTKCFGESSAQTMPIGAIMATRILAQARRIKACSLTYPRDDDVEFT
jgi:hypothetical protein